MFHFLSLRYLLDSISLNVVIFPLLLGGSIALTGGVSWLVLDSGGGEGGDDDLGGGTDLLAEMDHGQEMDEITDLERRDAVTLDRLRRMVPLKELEQSAVAEKPP